MSQLRIRTKGFKEVRLNVESFMSPIFAATQSNQTQSSEQHHPIRCQQPNIRFDVVFRSEKEYEAWQTFVRSIQLKLLKGKDPNDVAVVNLWWPERDIRNWQGLIKMTTGGGQRWNWTPREVVEVELTKGIVATASALWSFGTDFDAIFGGTINTIPPVDRLIVPPAPVTEPEPNFTDQYTGALTGGLQPPGSYTPGGSLGSLMGVV